MAKGVTSLESDVREIQMIFDTGTNKENVNDPTEDGGDIPTCWTWRRMTLPLSPKQVGTSVRRA